MLKAPTLRTTLHLDGELVPLPIHREPGVHSENDVDVEVCRLRHRWMNMYESQLSSLCPAIRGVCSQIAGVFLAIASSTRGSSLAPPAYIHTVGIVRVKWWLGLEEMKHDMVSIDCLGPQSVCLHLDSPALL